MFAKLNEKSIIKVNPEAYTKIKDNSLYVITYDSENMFILDEHGKDIWDLIQKPVTLTGLFSLCEEKFENFDVKERQEVRDFLLELHDHHLVTFEK